MSREVKEARKCWPRLLGSYSGTAGEIRLDAEVGAAPIAEFFHQGNQFPAFRIQRISDLGGAVALDAR
jgi:hypothetical protein